MNNVIPIGATVRTMTSREIAELTNKEHKNVLADIRAMLDDLGLTSADFSADLPDAYGRLQPAFQLPKRECLILVSGYSVAMRARIIDRWQELEQATPAAPALPQTYIAALEDLLAAKKAEQLAIEQRDEAIRTKALIGSKREATAMATAAAAKRESTKLRQQLGAGVDHATITAVQNATGTEYPWPPLRRWCRAEGISPVNVPDKRYGHVNSWPRCAWMAVHGVDLAELFGEVTA